MHNCPFCGSSKLKVERKANGYMDNNTGRKHKYYTSTSDVALYTYSVRCNKCHSRGGTASSENDAIVLWDTRYNE